MVYRRTTIRQNTSVGAGKNLGGEDKQAHVVRSFLWNFRTERVYTVPAKCVKVSPPDCFAYNQKHDTYLENHEEQTQRNPIA